jgi:NAD+ diphosphatase
MDFQNFFQNCPHCGSASFCFNNIKSKRCVDCGYQYYMNPSAAVAAFVRNDEGELLVCKRAKEPAKGTYDLPGGFVDFDESAEGAVARELAEELGAKVLKLNYLFSLPNTYLYSGLTIPTLDLFYECTLEDCAHLSAADDVEAIEFISLSELNPADFGLHSIRKAVGIYQQQNTYLL